MSLLIVIAGPLPSSRRRVPPAPVEREKCDRAFARSMAAIGRFPGALPGAQDQEGNRRQRPPGKLPIIIGPSPCAVKPRTHPVTPGPWDVVRGTRPPVLERPVVQGAGVEPATAGFSDRRSAC